MDRTNRLAAVLANGTSRVAADAPPYSLSHEEYLKANRIMGALGIIGALNKPGDPLKNDTETIRFAQQHSQGDPQQVSGIRYLLANYIDKGKPLPRKRWISDGGQTSAQRESGRIAQPEDKLEYRPDEDVTPPLTEVDQRAKIYRDTDDLEDDEDLGEEPGEKSVLLFGGDDDDDGLDKSDDEIGKETLRKSRLKLMAGMIWAELGEPDAVVEESAPNELSVRVQDLSWKVTVGDDGKVQISGFDSGAEQFVGKIPDEDAEAEIVKISDHIHQLIAEDIDEKSTPAEPPVHFGPEDTGVEGEELAGEGGTPPVAPGGDEGIAPEETAVPPDLAAPPAGGEMPFGAGAPPAPAPAPAPGGMPPMGAPPTAPPAPGGAQPAPGQFPVASRRQMRLTSQVRRVATARLETVSNELESIGVSLGEEGREVFGDLADRVRSIVDWID